MLAVIGEPGSAPAALDLSSLHGKLFPKVSVSGSFSAMYYSQVKCGHYFARDISEAVREALNRTDLDD